MKKSQVERTRRVEKEYSLEETSLFDFLNGLHAIQKIHVIEFEANELIHDIIQNKETIKVDCKLNDLIELIQLFPNCEIISQTTLLSPFIIQIYNQKVHFILESQEYQCLGIIGQLDKITNRYYIQIPFSQLDKYKEKFLHFPSISYLIWSPQTDNLKEYLTSHQMSIKIQPHYFIQQHYKNSPFDLSSDNVYDCIGGICAGVHSILDPYDTVSFNVTRLINGKQRNVYHSIIQGTLQFSITKNTFLSYNSCPKVIVLYCYNSAPLLNKEVHHGFNQTNNSMIITLLFNENKVKTFVEFPYCDHFSLH
ncbi:hypothetical protein EHI8A_167730 [Entamoeba histolytica HM-1:IMSS-B]|uniref:Uncharacterized protein n=4 Tax=Entamoeba histolytica TaxID=5759 RepID=C4M6K8_ENTH1|nr:hypothetical protein EHI_065300 [Entamoeba histolytica HM-1:IMSS]EAL47027.1 hypothetical protein EHI_065300 [Entamoeba histolytica HM-1:IMSS]EMH74562.1 hypothetical protein EHI8A_167730 [Entamoeba histolytica HM-1:IMSS-B]ENY64676.1 hypothetical protein EHI7A_147680 [Entamoeba histolytica HM-1:IMSS-A]GAT97126.1 hypothetical protein CL6EHI_065300 [Entamoeba histolytica]|eukprot:XP_652396.1 hypothetical protein EHI_065300 [Entamoeba histolytica HM-1:IMSS]